jgi:hypothetical protein
LGEIGLLQATTSSMTFFSRGEPEYVCVGGGNLVVVARQSPPSNLGPIQFNILQYTQVGSQLLRLVERTRDEENAEIFSGVLKKNQKQAFLGTSFGEFGYPYTISRQII